MDGRGLVQQDLTRAAGAEVVASPCPAAAAGREASRKRSLAVGAEKQTGEAGTQGGAACGCDAASDEVQHKRQKVGGHTLVLPGLTVEMKHTDLYGAPTGLVYSLLVLNKLGRGGNGTTWRVRRVESSSGTTATVANGGSSSSSSKGGELELKNPSGGGSGDGSQADTAVAGAGAVRVPPPGRDLCLKVAYI
jgi:hypothetical protein